MTRAREESAPLDGAVHKDFLAGEIRSDIHVLLRQADGDLLKKRGYFLLGRGNACESRQDGRSDEENSHHRPTPLSTAAMENGSTGVAIRS